MIWTARSTGRRKAARRRAAAFEGDERPDGMAPGAPRASRGAWEGVQAFSKIDENW